MKLRSRNPMANKLVKKRKELRFKKEALDDEGGNLGILRVNLHY